MFREERLCRARSRLAVAGALIERIVTVEPPYRLDLTVDVLRRFSTNVVDVVDVVDGAGEYVRALGPPEKPLVVRVRQTSPAELRVRTDSAANETQALAFVRRVLGVARTTPAFDRGAAQIPWLRELAARMRGVRAPRYPTLWEACVNAIVFQAISLHAASSILRRTIVALGAPLRDEAGDLWLFPGPGVLSAASDAVLRATGLSRSKIGALRGVAELVTAGSLREETLEGLASDAAALRLGEIRGVGRWTATVILLRGLGRLDVFPARDSGVARGVTVLAGGSVDLAEALRLLGPDRGMLYYHLLLARLEASGRLALPALPAARSRP